MSVLSKSFAALLLPLALGKPLALSTGEYSIQKRSASSFVWASVGDSWASGVSYDGKNTDYDSHGDINNCHRWNYTYGALMERDNTWTTGPQEFHFAACRSPSVILCHCIRIHLHCK
jgi:hypothetical protein